MSYALVVARLGWNGGNPREIMAGGHQPISGGIVSSSPAPSASARIVFVVGCVAVLAVILANAWVGEDARITFRTVDNFVNGYGLRWNVDERVQTFTHPLWTFALSVPYFVTRSIDWSAILVCLACSMGAVVMLARQWLARPWQVVGCVFIPVVACRSIVMFSTSGFENPMGFLLITWFAITLVHAMRGPSVPWFRLVLIASLGVSNRLDCVLVFAPGLLLIAVHEWRRIAWRQCLLGALPLVAWLGFSLFYFGFLVPNTAPAKLSAGRELGWYVERGLADLALLGVEDPVTTVLLVSASLLTVVHLVGYMRSRQDWLRGAVAALGLAMMLYSAYVVRIGGGFIVGRFWTLPLWLAILVIAFSAPSLVTKFRRSSWGRRLGCIAAVAVLVLCCSLVQAWAVAHRPVEFGPALRRSMAASWLDWDLSWKLTPLAEYFIEQGENARSLWLATGRPAWPLGVIGFAGIAAGREPILVDPLGLGDALLARLRPEPGDRIGHLTRTIPDGYLEARNTGSLAQMHPALQQYYGHLRRITSGPLFSLERLKTIVAMNLGAYDELLAEYERSRGR